MNHGSPPATGVSLSCLLEPQGVVVIGASASPGKLGHAMMTSLSGFTGVVAAVNPSGNHPSAFASVAEAAASHPSILDLAVLCIPAQLVPRALLECSDAGIGAALVCSGGFAEIGEAGIAVQRDLEDAIDNSGLRVLGPNTSGFFRPGAGLFATFVPGAASLRPGAVGLVAASGGVNHALAFQLDQVGAGVSLGVGVGAGTDVQAPDVIDYLARDPSTKAVALHLENVSDGQRLLRSVRECALRKPIAVLVVGRNDISEFATSHTGALATSWATTRALLRQAGAVVVDTEVELVNAASALSAPRVRKNGHPGIGLVTGQAGPGLIIADELATRGLELPSLGDETAGRLAELLPPLTFLGNPVDTGRPSDTYPDIIWAVAEDPAIDVLGVYGITEPVITLPAAVAAAAPSVPTVVAVDGPAEEILRVREAAHRDIPVLVGPTALVHGLSAITADAKARARESTRTEDVSAPTSGVAQLSAGPWHEAAAKDLLDVLGFTTPARRVCASGEDARRALDDLRAPLAVKILDATVLHKTDIGGVHLGVRDAATMAAAIDALAGIGATEFLVESMAPSGRDLILGVRRDPVFGPIVVLGLGGVEAEIWEDTAICGAPSSLADLAELPDRLRSRALVDGHRGGPVLDRPEFARVARRLLDVLVEHPQLSEIEINPLRLTHTGLVALDAVVIAQEDQS